MSKQQSGNKKPLFQSILLQSVGDELKDKG
jgi:hypothetical protein